MDTGNFEYDEYAAKGRSGFKRDGKDAGDPSPNSKKPRNQETFGGNFADSSPLTDMFSGSPVPPMDDQGGPGRPRRSALWVDGNDQENFEYDGDARSMSRPRTMMNVRPVTAMTMSDGDFVQMIPDLDEALDEDFVQKTADAPNILVNKLASYHDFQKDILKQSAFASLDKIDLSCLVKSLVLQHETKEEDEPWTWDNLISDAASQLPDISGLETD